MRKQSISRVTNSWLARPRSRIDPGTCALMLACLLGACEPVVATVGVGVMGRGLDTDRDVDESPSEGDGDVDELDGDVPPDTARRDAGGKDAGTSEDWGDVAIVGNCVRLIDVSSPFAASANGGVVAGTTVKSAMCPVAEATGPEASPIWWRRDGKLLMEAGESYSYRWPAGISLLTALRLFGGSEKCSADKIHDQGAMLPEIYLPSPGCAEIKSDFDVTYLRMAQLYGQWDLGSGFVVRMQLCKEPCPAMP
jgi:hypothetical protein